MQWPASRSFFFDLPLSTKTACIKVICYLNIRYSAKETVVLLFPWKTLYVVILKCILSEFYSFHLPVFTQTAFVKVFFPKALVAPQKSSSIV